MIKFSENLKALRHSKNVTQYALSRECGITVRTIIRYENGERIPDIETACTLADYFNVSLDYLCGRTEEK